MSSKRWLDVLDRILPFVPADGTFDIVTAVEQYNANLNINALPLRISDIEPEIRNEIERLLIHEHFAEIKNDTSSFNDILANNKFQLTNAGVGLKNAGSYKKYNEHLGIVQESNEFKRLDWMLDFMALHTVQGRGIESCWKEIKKLHPTIHIEYNESYREQMIKKLVGDGYMEYEEKTGICQITLEGILFKQSGAYIHQTKQIQLKEEQRKEELKYQKQLESTNSKLATEQTIMIGKQTDIQEAMKRLTKWITVGTIVAAIGAIIAAIFYIFSLFDFYEKHTSKFQFICYFLTGFFAAFLLVGLYYVARQIYKGK